MKRILMGATALVFCASLADPAAARKRGSSAQKMLFVAETKMQGAKQENLALCHLIKDQGIFFINLFRSSEGYVLAGDNCVAESYYNLPDGNITAAKAAGAIASDVPDTPTLSFQEKLAGHWGWLLVLGFVGFGLVGFMQKRKRSKMRAELLGDINPVAKQMLDAMCHAAKADGSIDASEVAAIAAAASQITGETFSPETVSQIAHLAEADLDKKDFAKFVKGTDAAQKEAIMEGVLQVVAADGQLDGKEQAFVGGLAAASGMNSDKVNEILNRVLAEKA